MFLLLMVIGIAGVSVFLVAGPGTVERVAKQHASTTGSKYHAIKSGALHSAPVMSGSGTAFAVPSH